MLTENNWNLRESISTLKKTFLNVLSHRLQVYLLNPVEKKKNMEKSGME